MPLTRAPEVETWNSVCNGTFKYSDKAFATSSSTDKLLSAEAAFTASTKDVGMEQVSFVMRCLAFEWRLGQVGRCACHHLAIHNSWLWLPVATARENQDARC